MSAPADTDKPGEDPSGAGGGADAWARDPAGPGAAGEGIADLSGLLAVAGQVADAAARVIRPLFRAGLRAEAKGDDSPVTRADRDAEQAMREVLGRLRPADGVLGEEYGLERPDAALRWVIDPLDGTRAFITGRPSFGVLVALLDSGRPVLGVLDQPVTGERWSGGGRTSFQGRYGGRVGVRTCADLGEAELSCTAPEIFAPDEAARFARLQAAARRTSWGGDCYAYGLLALGQIDVVAEAGMKPWDWAALVPLVEGAGGLVRDWQGRPLRLDGPGQVLAVGDPALLDQAVAALSP